MSSLDGTEPDGRSSGLSRAWDRIGALPTSVFIVWITTLLVLRAGVSWGGTVSAELEHFARTFPHPGATYRSNAVLGSSLAWVIDMNSYTKWLALHVGLTAGWFALTAVLLRRRVGSDRAWRVAMVWLTFLAVPASLLNHLGWYDVFTAIGVTLVALGGTPVLMVLGGAIMGATNVEQGAAAVLCGALVSWAIPASSSASRSFRGVLSRFVAALAGLALARIALVTWFHVVGATVPNRFGASGRLLPASLENAATLGGTGIYSWLGAGWIIVVVVLWRIRDYDIDCHRRPPRWIASGIGLIALPALATITTLDGSRVFSAVGGVALLLALVWFSQMSDQPSGEWILKYSAALMIFGILIPTVVTTYRGGIRVPWRFVLNL